MLKISRAIASRSATAAPTIGCKSFSAQAASPKAAPKAYSEFEFPDRAEPPVISRNNSANIQTKSSILSEPPTISPTRSIGPDRPSHIPPNVSTATLEIPETSITTLHNGVRVGSIENYSQVTTVGVLLEIGSRQELDSYTIPSSNTVVSTAGVNHLMELLAFQSTQSHNGEAIKNIMENLGAVTLATSGREQMMYCVDVLRPNVSQAFGILGETIKSPMIDEVEVEEMKQVINFQLMDIMPQILLGEGLQMAAYGPLEGTLQQLGRPHLCTTETLSNLTPQSVHAFREQYLLDNPEGIVVSGSGIGHDDLVELAEATFGHITPSADGKSRRIIPSIYTGGEFRKEQPPNPNSAKEEFAHVALAFEVGGWHSMDLVPTCVLQTLLGGGSSFSAGGPGKGMYSRLYRTVLNRYGWVESAEAFSSFHEESGLWGICGSCKPNKAGELTKAIVEQFLVLENQLVSDEELDRARNMLKCNVLTQLESRLVLFEDIGRQIATYGKREDAVTMCAKIDAVTKEDIQNVVKKAVIRPATMSSVGRDLSKVPKLDVVKQLFGSGLPKRAWF